MQSERWQSKRQKSVVERTLQRLILSPVSTLEQTSVVHWRSLSFYLMPDIAYFAKRLKARGCKRSNMSVVEYEFEN